MRVRERWGDSSSRLIALRVAVLPARGASAGRSPLVLLQGGPGVAGIPMARRFSTLAVLREGRDVVVLDQRGTGASNRLSCADLGRRSFFGVLLPRDHVSACRQRLAERADLEQYQTTASARDLEAIRRALGYERMDVWGFSFGSRVAMAYAREYPDRVRALILDGVVPFDVGLVADLAQSLQQSIEYVLARCAQDAACRDAYPDPAGTLRRIVTRLDRAPVEVHLTDPAGGTSAVRVGRWEFAYAVRGLLYGARAAALPAMLHSADSSGDFSAFARVYAERSGWPGDATGLASHLGAYCAEDLPFVDAADVARRARGTLIGALYYEQYRGGCDAWPMARVPDAWRTPLRSGVPTLLFSGERDPVTPPAYGERVKHSLPRGRHVVIPGGGHAEPSPCKASVVATFLTAGSAERVDVSCLTAMRFPPFDVVRP